MPKLELSPLKLQSDPSRVVIRPFHIAPSAAALEGREPSRAQRIVDAVKVMDMRTCEAELALVTKDFGARHWQTRQVYMQRYKQVHDELKLKNGMRTPQKELIGAYFCHEYSYAAAALMNPSVVAHPDQSGLTPGSIRFVMSLRAVGEGHISSIAFREGILTGEGRFELLSQPPFALAAYEFAAHADGAVECRRYEEASLSGTVMFPFTKAQRNGLEDLRLVRFVHDGGRVEYIGTYTAYSGAAIQSELMLTDDFRSFRLQPMTGSAARGKGMALFPRKVDGAYAMIGRQDGENMFLLRSETLTHWEEGPKLMGPTHPWELVQIGNCGSPIEIDEGWLLLTHGVGAMRQYAIGAVLLDKQDPSKILGRSVRPILSPSDEGREGYVPNVVYSCGALANGRTLFLPYGVADSSVAFCWMDIGELVAELG